MARSAIHQNALLVSFQEAAWMLGVTKHRILQLIDEGLLKPHPVLADRITRQQIEDFALNYEHAQTNAPPRRTVDAQPAKEEEYEVPPLRLRS